MNYNKIDRRCQLTNTWLHIQFQDDISDELGNTIPYPNYHYFKNKKPVYCWLISGWFSKPKAIAYLNDIIARFKITYIDKCKYLKHSKDTTSSIKPYLLKEFQGLKSKAKKLVKEKYQRAENRNDYVFWCIKLYSEDLIRKDGLIIYSTLESWAFDNFIDHCKDKSTLKAKCRKTYNWYFDREWKFGRVGTNKTKEEIMASRQEHAKHMTEQRQEQTRKKVLTVVTGMFKEDYKKKDGTWNISKIAKDSGTSRNTVMKYLKEISST